MAQNAKVLLEDVTELPPLPAVAANVMNMAENDSTSATDLAQVLQTDQALTAKLIKISNSAYYGYSRQVTTVKEAVTLLGFRQVREVAIATALMGNFKGPDIGADPFDLDLFWGHSVAVAVTAEAVAKKTRACKPGDAFTAGILHDIGRLVLRKARPAEFMQAVWMAKSTGRPLAETEEEKTGFGHHDVGKVLGESWKFPSALIDAVYYHHDGSLTPQVDGLAGVVAQAHRVVLHYGLFCGYDPEMGEVAPLPLDLAKVEKMAGGIDLILDRAFSFIEAARGTPDTWFSTAGKAATG